MRTKRIIKLALFIPMIIYIYITVNYENDKLIRNSQENKFVIDKFRVDKTGDLTFNITDDNWPFKSYLSNQILLLSLKFDEVGNIRQSKLIFKINAYTKENGKVLNRLLLHEYINDSNLTILKDCQVSGGRYRLGLISNFGHEDITLKIIIINPDSTLNNLNPRLVIESYRGSIEVYGFSGLNVLANNILLIISVLCVIIYVILSFRNEKIQKD